jgi:hypothetical protein
MLRRPKAGWDVVWDAAGNGRGIFQHTPREASGIKRKSTEQKNSDNCDLFNTVNKNNQLLDFTELKRIPIFISVVHQISL